MPFWSCKVEEFSILEIKVKDLLGRYETLLAEHKALAENITFLNRVNSNSKLKLILLKKKKPYWKRTKEISPTI